MFYAFIASLLVIFICNYEKTKKSLHMLQQNWYNDGNRYLKWLCSNLKDNFLNIELLMLLYILFRGTEHYIYEIVIPYIEKDFVFFGDYKTMLQEYVQTDKKSLEYVLVKESGEAHNKTFEVEVKINNIIYGRGIGKSKKEAEQHAAFDAYKKSAK